MKVEAYNPVPLDVKATRKRWMKRADFAAAYDTLTDEFAALAELLRARQQAGMTQAQVAERMGIAQATVARLESSAGKPQACPFHRHPATLRRCRRL